MGVGLAGVAAAAIVAAILALVAAVVRHENALARLEAIRELRETLDE